MQLGFLWPQFLQLVQRFLHNQCLLPDCTLEQPVVPCSGDCSLLVRLVSEHPLGTNDCSIFWFWYQVPNLISLKLMKLILHSHNPVRISQSFMNILRFHERNKSMESTKIFNPWSCLHSRIQISKYLIKRMWFLMLPCSENRSLLCLIVWWSWFRNSYRACSCSWPGAWF